MSRFVRRSVMALAAVLPSAAHADDVGYQLETSIASNYVVRGIVQYAGRSDPSLQNTAALRVDHVGAGALLFTTWSAVAISEYDAQPGNALELDLTAAYEFNVGRLAVATGYAASIFPQHAEGTPVDGAHELFGMASYANPCVVPTVAAYAEVVRQQGAYVSVAASRNIQAGRWTFSPMVSVGAAAYRRYQGGDQSAGPHINDVTAAIHSRVDLGRGVYAAGRLSYALRGTPADLMETDAAWGFGGRSSLFGVIAVGLAR